MRCPNLPSPKDLSLDQKFSIGYKENFVEAIIKKVFRSVLKAGDNLFIKYPSILVYVDVQIMTPVSRIVTFDTALPV